MKTERGGWVYSQMFIDLDVIHDWGRLPSEFGLCDPDEDLNLMAAYSQTKSKMNAHESYRSDKKRRNKN